MRWKACSEMIEKSSSMHISGNDNNPPYDVYLNVKLRWEILHIVVASNRTHGNVCVKIYLLKIIYSCGSINNVTSFIFWKHVVGCRVIKPLQFM